MEEELCYLTRFFNLEKIIVIFATLCYNRRNIKKGSDHYL